jgi:hypothetical protein
MWCNQQQQHGNENAKSWTYLKRKTNGQNVKLAVRTLHLTNEENKTVEETPVTTDPG